MQHQDYMKLALEQALIAKDQGEVPIGGIIVIDNQVIALGFNQTITLNDPTAHAEILCIRQACHVTKNHRLSQATLYITLEPCIMCYGAIVQSRISHVVFGASDSKSGAFTKTNLTQQLGLNHRPEFTDNVMALECQQLLQRFFQDKR